LATSSSGKGAELDPTQPLDPRRNMESKPVDIDRALELARDGLHIDGAHHKQWYLEEILKSLGEDLPSEEEYEPGIAP